MADSIKNRKRECLGEAIQDVCEIPNLIGKFVGYTNFCCYLCDVFKAIRQRLNTFSDHKDTNIKRIR